ncbi:Gfo/Idh/MocA family protein [Halalkalibaculum sp. DA3122]|uniref:Gfo/Idh/MocA family protein n=1 Tax=unclassified Halalkalibaculum TaxID=2964617 RepID=UPI0037541B4C
MEQALHTQVTMPETPRPIFIIGAGGIVRDAHLPAYQKAGLPVKGIFDIQKGKAVALAEQYGIPHVYGSLQELITDSNQHVVYDLAVPASEIAGVLEYLPSNSAALIQKPLGEDWDEAQKIAHICDEKQMTAGVNFQLRYAPHILAARNLIREGALGEIHDIEIRLNVYTPWHLWEFLYDLPRVEILYHSIHYLDLVRSFLGNPKGIYAKTVKHPKMENLASTKSTMILDYGDRTRAVISTNHGHEFGSDHQESFVKIEGTKGAVTITLGVNMNYPEGAEDTFEYCLLDEGTDPNWQRVDIEGSWFPDAFAGSMGSFQCHLLETSNEFTSLVPDAVQTMALVEAAHVSSERGGTKPHYLNS